MQIKQYKGSAFYTNANDDHGDPKSFASLVVSVAVLICASLPKVTSAEVQLPEARNLVIRCGFNITFFNVLLALISTTISTYFQFLTFIYFSLAALLLDLHVLIVFAITVCTTADSLCFGVKKLKTTNNIGNISITALNHIEIF